MKIRTSLSLLLLSLVASSSAFAAPEVHGHRGARARVTENTLEAFDYALKAGVDVLELDVVATRDQALIVVHDRVLPPAFCGTATPVVIGKLNLSEVKKLRCRAPHAALRFPAQRQVEPAPLPTLGEVLQAVKRSNHPAAKQVRFNIETKTVPVDPTVAPARFAMLVIAELKRKKVLDRTILQSFDHDVLRSKPAQRARRHGLKLAALLAESHPEPVSVVEAAKADILSPNEHWIHADDVKRLHAAGLKVVPWTVNDPAGWARMVSLGVDGIITDDPEALIAWLAQHGHR